MAVVEKGPGDHPHPLAWSVVDDHCVLVADTQHADDAREVVGRRHVVVRRARDAAEAVEVYGTGDVARRILPGAAGVDDPHLRIVELTHEPFGVSEELRAGVATFGHRRTHWILLLR